MHRRRALELRVVDKPCKHRRRCGAKRTPQRVRVAEAVAKHDDARAAALGPDRRRHAAQAQPCVVVEAAAARKRAVEARKLHAHPSARTADARRRRAAQPRAAAAPSRRRRSLAKPTAHPARPRAARAHAHHRRAHHRAAPRMHVEHAHRHHAQPRAAGSVLARVVAHLEPRRAGRQPRRIAHERALARPRRAPHRTARAARQHAERLRHRREAAAVHRQRRAALRQRRRRHHVAHRRRHLVRVPHAISVAVLLAIYAHSNHCPSTFRFGCDTFNAFMS